MGKRSAEIIVFPKDQISARVCILCDTYWSVDSLMDGRGEREMCVCGKIHLEQLIPCEFTPVNLDHIYCNKPKHVTELRMIK